MCAWWRRDPEPTYPSELTDRVMDAIAQLENEKIPFMGLPCNCVMVLGSDGVPVGISRSECELHRYTPSIDSELDYLRATMSCDSSGRILKAKI